MHGYLPLSIYDSRNITRLQRKQDLGIDANLGGVHVKTIILQNRNTRAELWIVIATRAALCRRDCANTHTCAVA